ncbi:MAG TPA: ABC transporter permease [Blastocatellia bacterium]|nr:ABC transporter permease [Blastocatellia bacterium]
METVLQDLRYAIRASLNRPAFVVIVVLALAIGIGANTAIFSVVNAILLRPLPYKNPDRIVMIWMSNGKLGVAEDWHSYPNYVDYRDQNSTFEEVAAFNYRGFNLTGTGDPVLLSGAWSTANLFAVLGVDPQLGRTYTVEEEEPGRDLVAVISHGLWQRRFGGDPNIVGQPIQLNGVNRTVIGVMPAGFAFPQKETDVWVPLAARPQLKQARGAFWLKAVGRMKPGVTIEQARADMGVIANQLLERFPQIMESYGSNLVPLHEQVTGKVRPALLVLLAAVAFVLLIACANVANLLLARAAAREREIAIRTALGASRRRIVRQLLTESLLLAIVGGGLGLLLALWGLSALVALSPANIPRLDQIHIDGRVLAFTFAVSLVTGLIFGLVPALQASKPDLNEALKEGGRGTSEGRRGKRVRSLLVVSEIALALVLLIGAGLLIKSFIHLQKFDFGFNPNSLLTLRVQLGGPKYRQDPAVVNFFQQAVERMQNVPGMQSVGGISSVFLDDTPNSTNFVIEGRPVPVGAESIEVPLDAVTPDYFKTMGIPLLKGRLFDDRDSTDSLPVVIVNETFVKRFFEGEDPLGKRFCYGTPNGDPKEWKTIVGVVGDMRRTGFDKDVRPETFMPENQYPEIAMTVVARTAGDPTSYAPALRDAIWAVDKDQPVFDIKTMDSRLVEMTAQRRFNMLLIGIFAAVALVLASLGIYGVISYSVTQRMHELGVRIALGASRRDVMRLVVGQAARLSLLGVGVGMVAAFFLTRLMASLLYGTSATDLATFLLIPSLLTGVSLAASFVPARRAMKIDPMVALRYE